MVEIEKVDSGEGGMVENGGRGGEWWINWRMVENGGDRWKMVEIGGYQWKKQR